ncbi:MAG: hypothetical protein M1837_005738 [Sclerophora amabilis]|nr:MAG: hypothetical protein M1837_005738 [Sclerophora amabilis]
MSDVQKPVEASASTVPTAAEPTVEPSTTTSEPTVTPHAPTESAGTETKLAEPASTEAAQVPAATTDVPVTEDATVGEPKPVTEATTDAKPVVEGHLGYKAPGLVKSLRFSKKFFWFGEEPVTPKNLYYYLRGEKSETANHDAAWSSQTGKGLLYFAKYAESKLTPNGIINLADVSHLTKDAPNEFHFKFHGAKHTFQAASTAERDGWVAAIETRAAEAKQSVETITGSAGYKETKEKLGKPAGPVASTPAKSESSAPKKSTDQALEPVKKDNASTSSSSSSDAEGKKSKKQKSRSVSRKRASIFGSLLAKKDDHEEKKHEKKEDKAEDKAVKQAEKEEKKEEKKVEKLEKDEAKSETIQPAHAGEVPVETSIYAPAVAAAAAAEGGHKLHDEPTEASTTVHTPEGAIKETTTTTTKKDTPKETPKINKRNSLFGSLFQKKDAAPAPVEKDEKEITPTVPPKDVDAPVVAKETETPTVIPVAASEPVDAPAKPSTEVAEPVTAPVATESAAPTTTTPKKEYSSSPGKESFFGKFLKTEKTKFQQKKEEKAEDKTETVEPEESKTEATPVTAPTTETSAPVVTPSETPTTQPAATTTPEGTTTTTTAPVTSRETTPAEPAKDRRRSSFFSTLGTKKEKKSEVTSDTETGDAQSKPKPTQGSKIGELFRKPSRAVRGSSANRESSKKEAASPAPVPETSETAATTETPTDPVTQDAAPAATTAPEAQNTGSVENGAIGDVVPEAVSVGQSREQATPQVQAAA